MSYAPWSCRAGSERSRAAPRRRLGAAADPRRRGGHARRPRPPHRASPRSTVAQRVDALLAHELVYEAGGSASTGGRPPTHPRLQPARRRRARGRPRRHALAAGGQRPRRRAARRGRARPRHRQRARGGARQVDERFDDAARRGRAHAARTCAASASACRARSRSRPASPSTRRSCPAGTASRSRDWFAARYDGAGARRQRRQHHGPRRALVALARHRPPAVHQGRHRHRLRDRRRPR